MYGWQLVLIYLVIGFMLASIVVKVTSNRSDDDDAMVAFAFVTALWPLVVAGFILLVPAAALSKWVKFLNS